MLITVAYEHGLNAFARLNFSRCFNSFSMCVSGDVSAEDLFRMFFGGHVFTASEFRWLAVLPFFSELFLVHMLTFHPF